MLRLVSGAIFPLLVCWSGRAAVGARPSQNAACLEQQEYRSGSVCCQNCPAGTYVAEPCTAAGQRGTCQECDDGTFMEHSNGLRQCFRCTPCRSDQEVVTPCTHTLNTECRCGPGRFCDPDQACELCKKCSRCSWDEVAVRNCTPTANTECKKVHATPPPPADNTALIVLLLVLAVAVVVATGVCVWKRRRRTASQSSSEEQKPGQDLRGDGGALGPCWLGVLDTPALVRTTGDPEELRALRDSCSSSASTSQYSLTGLAFCSASAPPPAAPPQPPSWVRASHAAASNPASLCSPLLPAGDPDAPVGSFFLNFDLWRLQEGWPDQEPLPPLVAVNGEESLRRCFEFFEELDIDYYHKFFRRLNIKDNLIKGKEELPYDDRMHQLLHIWMEKEGRGASLDQLLQVLLDLNQRHTAEIIRDKAVSHGHYLDGEPG